MKKLNWIFSALMFIGLAGSFTACSSAEKKDADIIEDDIAMVDESFDEPALEDESLGASSSGRGR